MQYSHYMIIFHEKLIKEERIINMIDSNARLEKQPVGELPFSPLLRAEAVAVCCRVHSSYFRIA